MPITVVEGRRLALTSLEKVVYAAVGTCKAELLQCGVTSAAA
ncbi:hypothetical protein [Yinghuangia soli]